MQQARRRAARVRGQAVALGQRVRQVSQHRDGRARRQRTARAVVCGARDRGGLRTADQLLQPVPGSGPVRYHAAAEAIRLRGIIAASFFFLHTNIHF